MKSPDLTDIIAIPMLTIVFYAFCFLQAKAIRRGEPLTPVQKQMLAYGTVFVFVMGYLIVFQKPLGNLFHSENAWKLAIVIWAVLLSVMGWLRNRKERISN